MVLMDPNQNYDQETPSLKSHIIEFIQTIAVFVAISLFIYYFAIQPHKVSGASMEPNFHDKDFILTDKITYQFSEPKHGDIIVFKNPDNESQDYIKRIIALPGDKIMVKNGHIYLNGNLKSEPYLNPNLLTKTGKFLSDGKEVSVGENELITLGDNRDNSWDSKDWGYVPKKNIIGKAFFRYWPPQSIGLIKTDKLL